MPLPRILAGPALRRTDRRAVWIWLCTSESLTLSAEVYAIDDAQRLGARVGTTDTAASLSFSLSPTLHVHLVKVVPAEEFFDHTTVLGYRLFEGEGESLARLAGYDETLYGVASYAFPTFCIQNPRSNALRALFASCRKLHGDGDDASLGMLAQLEARSSEGVSRPPHLRPTALFLMGDQIYADDVASLIFPTVARLASELQLTAAPGFPDIGLTSVDARQLVMYREAGFTSGVAENHLVTLGEYAAMYLLAWNEQAWAPEELGRSPEALELTDREAVDEHNQRQSLLAAMAGSRAMRTLLANVPAYMMFDDHDVTDDWNINPSWLRHVRGKPLGKQIISNALVAYWAFQGWGNDPGAFDDDFLQQIRDFLAATGDSDREREVRDDTFDFLNCNQREHYWSFSTPTRPGALFLDLRTHRSAARDTTLVDGVADLTDSYNYSFARGTGELFGRPLAPMVLPVARSREMRLPGELGSNRLNGAAPRFLNSSLRRRARRLVESFTGRPMILVAGTPAVGASIVDYGQEIFIFADGSFTWDFENWRGDPENLLDLYELIHHSEASACILLSGDVHYASAFIGELDWPGSRGPRRMNIAQFTSSAAKNTSFPPAMLMSAVQLLLRTGGDLATRWLGAAPTGADGDSASVGRVRFVNATAMREFGPVFSLRDVPSSVLLPDFAYCDEAWQLQSLGGLGMYMDSNFGWLVASNDSDQVVSVQILDAANNPIGDTMRVATTPFQ